MPKSALSIHNALRTLGCLGLVVKAFSQPAPSLAILSDDGLPGVYSTHASYALRPGLLVFGLTNRFLSGPDLIQGGIVRKGPDARAFPVSDALIYGGQVFLGTGLGAGFDATIGLPYYYEYLSGLGSQPDNWGPGDLSAVLKWSLPLDLPFVSFSIAALGTAPTSPLSGPLLPKEMAFHPASGNLPNGLSHGLGQSAPRAGLAAGSSLDFSQAAGGPEFKLHANLAADRTLAGEKRSPLGTLSASVAAEAGLGKSFRLEGELRHQRLAVTPGTLGEPLARSTTASLGLGLKGRGGLALRIGAILAPEDWNPYVPLALRGDDGTVSSLAYRFHPPVAAFLQLAWRGFPFDRDMDHDGVADGKDICPTVAEDRDGFQDDDGCPDPDNDHDGVLDATDACPYIPEDHDGFEDRDGCPEADNDHDGLPDSTDKCPYDPEDKDGYQNDDGCPDLDDDLDGIPDALDKCPRAAENRNGVEDEDGCPETDSDGDRIPDSRDKCPREAEIVNFYQDEDGCPDEKPEPLRDAVLAGVRFVGNTAELDPASFLVLDGLAARLFAYPGTDIEVQGHLDDRWGPEAKAISRDRAQAVVEYLVNRGIESRRLKSVGYGSSRPLAPNRTAQGRETNRRIQIHRLN